MNLWQQRNIHPSQNLYENGTTGTEKLSQNQQHLIAYTFRISYEMKAIQLYNLDKISGVTLLSIKRNAIFQLIIFKT